MPERMKRALAKEAAAATAPTAKSGGVEPLGSIESVHVPALDAEHEECAAALAKLSEAPTREAIEKVIEAYAAHFEHEERLLDEHLYKEAAAEAAAAGGDLAKSGSKSGAAGAGGFSAAASMRRSHYADHKRMLVDLRVRAAALPAGGPASGPKAWVHVPNGEAPEVFVDKVLRSFEAHANRYDAAYAAPLAAKLSEAQAVPAQ